MESSKVHNGYLEQDFFCLIKISELINQVADPAAALAQVTEKLHEIMIFDNLVVYGLIPQHGNLEVIYARALGRGKQAEADIDWGERLANQLLIEKKTILEKPRTSELTGDRLKRPFLLGVPIFSGKDFLGVVILIRFGGPEYTPRDLQLAQFFAQQTGALLERETLSRERERLQARQELLQLQEDFLSTISHELNSPLGFIKGYTTTLLRPDANWDSKTQMEFLNIIDEETVHMQELISNLLDSARAQSNQLKMDFEAVRLDSLINDIVAKARITKPGLQIEVDLPKDLSAITGDPKRLSQVLENLINNAIKYAPGAPVNISVTQDDQTTTILFTDQGPGIPSMYLHHMFERFFRIPENSYGIHGSGLGLYICKKIITAHHGMITVESTVGQGTTFKTILPNQQRID